jgi:Zn-dependent protease with chaperone function
MTRRRVCGVLAVVIGPLGWCLLLGGLVGGDPMFAVEIGGVALAATWGGFVVRELVGSNQLARTLSVDASEIQLFGVLCRVTPALGTDALVVGSVRPRIVVGSRLVDALAQDELEAVVYHEDYHRRTRAPLRAAALSAWLHLLGRSGYIRGMVLGRLTDLETLADADAMHRGSSPRSLARALLKGDVGLQPAAFSYAAVERVDRLLDRAAGVGIAASSRPPYEWLPVALLAVATLACHAGL